MVVSQSTIPVVSAPGLLKNPTLFLGWSNCLSVVGLVADKICASGFRFHLFCLSYKEIVCLNFGQVCLHQQWRTLVHPFLRQLRF